MHLGGNQRGFGRGRRAQDTLLAPLSVIEPRVHAGELTCALFLGWRKAYDRVTHKAMPARLAGKGDAWDGVEVGGRIVTQRIDAGAATVVSL